MDGPRVTIGIPAYNNARTLERAIASVRAQSFEDWRLVISDDLSSDGTWEICQRACAADPRISARRQDRRRVYMNFADLLASATTPYFAWLAGDDLWEPGFLARTVAALDETPAAVSALPACVFFDPETGQDLDPPDTSAIEGSRTERIRTFLRRPGGTRMYGLFRTGALRRAFPRRMMNAYDWRMMLGVLAQGTQIAIPEVLMRRERTPWIAYAEVVDRIYRFPPFRRFPALDMSLSALGAGLVPPSALGDLIRLNLAKHEEYLLLTRPAAYRRRAGLFRWLGLPLSRAPATRVSVARGLLGRSARQSAGAARILEDAAAGGNAGAALALGHARADGIIAGDALAAFRRAAELGDAEGAFHAAIAAQSEGQATAAQTRAQILRAAEAGSEGARLHLAQGLLAGVPPGALALPLAWLLEEGARRGDALSAHALGRLAEGGGAGAGASGHDPLILYEAAASARAEAALDAGRLRRDRGDVAKAAAHFRRAADARVPGAAMALAACNPQGIDPAEVLMLLVEAQARAEDHRERADIADWIETFDEATCLAVACRILHDGAKDEGPGEAKARMVALGYLRDRDALRPADVSRLYCERQASLA